MTSRFTGAFVALLFLFGTAATVNADFVAFSSIPGPYSAFPGITDGELARNAAFTGFVGEDYSMDLSGSLSPNATERELSSMRFVGGVSLDGAGGLFVSGALDFNFFDANEVLVNSTTVTLPAAGNFIWTINFGPGFMIPTEGFMAINIDESNPLNVDSLGNNLLGQWFIGGVPTIGSSPEDVVNTVDRNHTFEFTVVPEPGTAGLIGLALLGGCFARRRQS